MITIDQFINNLAQVILNPLIYLMFALAVVYFLWGVFLYIKNADSETERAKGAKGIMYGLIGMVIMLGVYGILNIFTGVVLGVTS